VNLVETGLPGNLVTLRKSLVTAMTAKVVVDVAAEDAGTEVTVMLLVNLAITTKTKLKKPLKPLFCDETWAENAATDELTKKMIQKNHVTLTALLFESNGEESADVNGSLTPLSQTEFLILMVLQEKLSLEKLMKKWRVFL